MPLRPTRNQYRTAVPSFLISTSQNVPNTSTGIFLVFSYNRLCAKLAASPVHRQHFLLDGISPNTSSGQDVDAGKHFRKMRTEQEFLPPPACAFHSPMHLRYSVFGCSSAKRFRSKIESSTFDGPSPSRTAARKSRKYHPWALAPSEGAFCGKGGHSDGSNTSSAARLASAPRASRTPRTRSQPRKSPLTRLYSSIMRRRTSAIVMPRRFDSALSHFICGAVNVMVCRMRAMVASVYERQLSPQWHPLVKGTF